MTLGERWERFWFEEGPATGLGAFRIVFGLCLLLELPVSYYHSAFAMDGPGFQLSYTSLIPHVSPGLYDALHLLQLPLIALLIVGAWTRSASAGLAILQGWLLFADPLGFRNHPYLFWLVLLLLAVSPAGRALGLDGRGAAGGARASRAVQRLLQVQICLVYFIAGLHKLNPAFLGGEVLAHMIGLALPHSTLGGVTQAVLGESAYRVLEGWTARPELFAPLAWFTLLCEFGLPVALWLPRLRMPAMCLGAAFHAGIAVSTEIWSFSIAMIGSYLLFADPERWSDRLPRWLGGVSRARGEDQNRYSKPS